MPKTTDQISAAALKRVQLLLMQELPEPTCSGKKAQWRWQVEQVKKKVATQLWPESSGINIEIKS